MDLLVQGCHTYRIYSHLEVTRTGLLAYRGYTYGISQHIEVTRREFICIYGSYTQGINLYIELHVRNLFAQSGYTQGIYLHIEVTLRGFTYIQKLHVQGFTCIYPIKKYSGVSVEFRQIKAAMGAPKQQMLPSFWSDNSTAITGDFNNPIV